MAINDVSLTSGMRANLTALQGTVSLLNRTQQRLSTGKAVNSALDNAVNFFSAQSLNSRASDLAGFKDGMSNAVQTIQAADKGITGITTLLNSAKATAASVVGLPASTAYQSANINIGDIADGKTIIVTDGTTTITLTADVVHTTNAVTGAGSAGKFGTLGLTASQIAANVSSLINAVAGTGITSSGVSGTSVAVASTAANITAPQITGTAVTDGTASANTVAANSARGSLVTQYNNILGQIDKMVNDSSFQGVNLLKTGSMTVNFGGSNSLVVNGAASDSTSLGLSTITTAWNGAGSTGSAQMTLIDSALSQLQSTSSSLSSNLTIIQSRQDFSTNLINVLQTGADNLTLADTNQEGANMLMLQTRQSLGTTALSLSSQAAQSVLRLFQ